MKLSINWKVLGIGVLITIFLQILLPMGFSAHPIIGYVLAWFIGGLITVVGLAKTGNAKDGLLLAVLTVLIANLVLDIALSAYYAEFLLRGVTNYALALVAGGIGGLLGTLPFRKK